MTAGQPDEPLHLAPHRAGAHPGFGSGLRIWLARHAQVHTDWSTRAYGSQDVPLSPAGLERTEEFAASLARLAPDEIHASDLDRAARLGRAVAHHCGNAASLHPSLREVHRGAWEGLEVAELRAHHAEQLADFYAAPWDYRGHGGESDADVARRAWPLLAEACERARGRGGCLVIAAHYNVIRCLASVALGLDPAHSFSLRIETARALVLEDKSDGFRLLASNVFDPGAFDDRDEHLTVIPTAAQ